MMMVYCAEICPALSLEGGTVESNGTVAKFSCDSGRILIGSESATCNSEGNWTVNNAFPACIGKETNTSFICILFVAWTLQFYWLRWTMPSIVHQYDKIIFNTYVSQGRYNMIYLNLWHTTCDTGVFCCTSLQKIYNYVVSYFCSM